MAFQFQTVVALSPFYMTTLGIGLADIGLLIGVYLCLAIFIALPGAAIGKRFGDKQTVAFGTVLMLLGGIVAALLPSWEALVTGRILAGVGGVILNVLMSKIVTDRFPGQKLSTAMGIFVNSWPVGIAAGVLVLPVIAENYGLQAALWVTNGLIAIGLALLIVLYQSPENVPQWRRPKRCGCGGRHLFVCCWRGASGALQFGSRDGIWVRACDAG